MKWFNYAEFFSSYEGIDRRWKNAPGRLYQFFVKLPTCLSCTNHSKSFKLLFARYECMKQKTKLAY